jgi:hypothetical protein
VVLSGGGTIDGSVSKISHEIKNDWLSLLWLVF